MDEVFVDLCRQMLRKDDAGEAFAEEPDKFDPYSYKYYKDRRRQRKARDRDPSRPRCVVL